MPENKSCVSCGREIPQTADTCVFCGARQHVSQLRHTAVLTAVRIEEVAPAPAPGAATAEAAPAGSESKEVPSPRRPPAHPSQTDDTLTNLGTLAREAVAEADRVAEREAEAEKGAEKAAEPAPAPALSPAVAEATRLRAARAAALWALRLVMLAAGATLVVLFVLNATLLGALGGNPLILATYYLVGGVVLLGGAMLPLPARMRATVAVLGGAVPVFVAPPMVALDGWRGLAAAFVVLLLPGALLLRARVRRSALARGLVAIGVLLVALIYVVPVQGVVPLSLPLSLLGTGAINATIVGLVTLLPLGLALATLSVFLPPRSTGGGNVWASCLLLAVSGSVAMAGLGGGRRTDLALVHLGVCLLAAGATAAAGVAHLLDVEAPAA